MAISLFLFFLEKCSKYVRNSGWPQNEIFFSIFFFLSFFLTTMRSNRGFAFANKQLLYFDSEIKILISCLILFVTIKMHIAKSFHFCCVLS